MEMFAPAVSVFGVGLFKISETPDVASQSALTCEPPPPPVLEISNELAVSVMVMFAPATTCFTVGLLRISEIPEVADQSELI